MSGNKPEKNRQVLPAVRWQKPNREMGMAPCLGKSNGQSLMGKSQQNFVKENISVKISQKTESKANLGKSQ